MSDDSDYKNHDDEEISENELQGDTNLREEIVIDSYEPEIQDDEELGEGNRRRIIKKPKKYDDFVMLTYQEAVTGPDKNKWISAIEEEKIALDKKYYQADGFSESKMMDEDSVMDKWRNVRDAFRKSLRKSIDETQKRKYIYHDNLQFLLTVSEKEHPLSMRDPQEDHSVDAYSEVVVKEEMEEHEPDEYDQRRASSEESEKRKQTDKAKLSISNEFDEAVIAVLEKSGYRNEPLDEDEAFFKSLLPSVRTMTQDEKLKFRVEVIRSIQNIRMQNKDLQQWSLCILFRMKGLHQGDISSCFRVGHPSNNEKKPRPIIMKFRDLLDKVKLFKNLKNLKNKSIFITEDLTRERRTLLKTAKTSLPGKKIWTFKGQIFIKINDSNVKISSLQDIQQYVQ
ncbi:hypothetical protein JTB14_022683 [Gonioctena quinquepunctata]|nr:hypothetical protein JTB14_022683 [Gonioctena quinquepunctata]